MVAPVGLDLSKVMDMTGWNKMVADMTIEEPVMAAKPTELTPTLAHAKQTGIFTLLSLNPQRIMSRLL